MNSALTAAVGCAEFGSLFTCSHTDKLNYPPNTDFGSSKQAGGQHTGHPLDWREVSVQAVRE